MRPLLRPGLALPLGPGRRRRAQAPRRRGGATIVEFAFAASIFLTLMFGALEFARMLFVWNSMQEVTRRAARAAVVSNFTDNAALAQLKAAAVFADPQHPTSIFGTDVGADHIRITYLNRDLAEVSPLPASPNANLANCASTPAAAACIRFVRVQICANGSGAACEAVHYSPIVPVFPALSMPLFPVIIPAQSLGCGIPVCP
ncbi:MAG: TadE family protein [Pseudomonadota bacterium]